MNWLMVYPHSRRDLLACSQASDTSTPRQARSFGVGNYVNLFEFRERPRQVIASPNPFDNTSSNEAV